jgi:RND superfamily putative drug exporter
VARWTRTVVAHRKKILALWVVLFALGGYATSHLGDLLTNRFSVPGSDAERGLQLVEDRMHARGDGDFTVLFRAQRGRITSRVFVREAGAAAQRAATAIHGAKAGPVLHAAPGVVYVELATPLQNAEAASKTPAVRRAIGDVPGARAYVTGYPAVNHDIDPIYNDDIARGETIAVPIAVLVMAFMFGTLVAIAVPLVFALMTIPATLGAVWIFAHFMDMAIYIQNIVTLIGVAIAIDYSMLVVFRFREELARDENPHDALERTMVTAGRATLFSGMTVAVGLALLVLMPVPFMQSMGVGGVVLPIVAMAASATLLPALLAVMGHRINRLRVIPRGVLEARAEGRKGMWTRLARSIMRRPVPYLLASAGLMLALLAPATGLSLTGGDNRGVPKTTESTKGLAILEATLGPGSLAPNQIVVDTGRPGGAWSAESLAAQKRLIAELRADPEVVPKTVFAPALLVRGAGRPSRRALALARQANLVDPRSRVVQVRAASRHDIGTHAAMDLVDRIRNRYVPEARFAAPHVYLTGAAAFDVDFLNKAYGAFPWLILGVLVISYLVLLRAFRSLFLPIKAVFMNLLSVGATYGVLTLVFQHGWGGPIGLDSTPQIEGWIPIFLFAMLFGLSMDYEVFLLSRMREEWDKGHDNETAVAYGLERTGRIITAAAVIMVAAFSGFTFGSFVGLQEFGIGLSAAIILDATVVRALLVPAAMKLLGHWNWYLPERVRRALRLAPAHPAEAAHAP